MSKQIHQIPRETKPKNDYFKIKDVLRRWDKIIPRLSDYAKKHISFFFFLGKPRIAPHDCAGTMQELLTSLFLDVSGKKKDRWLIAGGNWMKDRPWGGVDGKLKDGQFHIIKEATFHEVGLRLSYQNQLENWLSVVMDPKLLDHAFFIHFWKYEIWEKGGKKPVLVLVNETLKKELEDAMRTVLKEEEEQIAISRRTNCDL